jgi:DNA invertase Pin-like site-specific DNA recombinase
MLDTARPVAYIRRSVIRRGNEGDLSREFQVAEVRRLAGDDGPSLAVIDGDWGRSARHDKTDKRLAFLAMLESIERGEVSTLYAFATDRLARSVEWSARLLNACERAGTTIVTGEGRFAPGDDGPRITFQVLAVMNENAVRAMGRKALATRKRRDLRGDRRGSPPYGWS